jgi:transposase
MEWSCQASLSIKVCPPRLIEDPTNDLKSLGRTNFTALHDELRLLDVRMTAVDQELKRQSVRDGRCPRLTAIEGVAPLSATALVATVADPRAFTKGRHLGGLAGPRLSARSGP